MMSVTYVRKFKECSQSEPLKGDMGWTFIQANGKCETVKLRN